MTIGIDLAKNVFSVHGVDENGKVALQRTVRRDQLLELIAKLSPCVIAMEACWGAHHWARQFAALGHTPKLIAPKFVTPYRMSGKRGKNDAADAAAILAKPLAVRRCVSSPSKPSISRAPCACIGCARASSRGGPRPSTRMRGLLCEFGIALPQNANTVRRQAAAALEDLPGWANRAIGDLLRSSSGRTTLSTCCIESIAPKMGVICS